MSLTSLGVLRLPHGQRRRALLTSRRLGPEHVQPDRECAVAHPSLAGITTARQLSGEWRGKRVRMGRYYTDEKEVAGPQGTDGWQDEHTVMEKIRFVTYFCIWTPKIFIIFTIFLCLVIL
jgi:hypothetical protein